MPEDILDATVEYLKALPVTKEEVCSAWSPPTSSAFWQDSFDAPDGTAIADHTPEVGGGYTSVDEGFQLQGGALISTIGGALAHFGDEGIASDFEAALTIQDPEGGATDYIWFIFRDTGPGEDQGMRLSMLSRGYGAWTFYLESGTGESYARHDIDMPLGEWHDVTLTANGTSISVSINGNEVITETVDFNLDQEHVAFFENATQLQLGEFSMLPVEAEQPTPTQAQPADAFADSAGVNVHMFFNDTPYYKQYETVKSRLNELGIRYVRDGILNPDDWREAYLLDLYDSTGIQVCAIIDDRKDGQLLDPSHLQAKFDMIEEHYNNGTREVIAVIEGPNEYDISGNREDDWPAVLQAYQSEIYSQVQSRAAFDGFTVLSPSIVWEPDAAGDFTDTADAINMHPYPGGEQPTNNFDMNVSKYAPMGTGLETYWATETGYHNALNAEGAPGAQISQPGIPEQVEAKYLPRMFAEYFRRGVGGTYTYELLDLFPDNGGTNQEHHFGLLRHDLSRKPVFDALSNLFTIIEDTDPNANGSLAYDLAGADSNTRDVLLQKGDGSFWLMLWQEVSSYDIPEGWQDGEQGTILDPDPVPVTVQFEEPKNVSVYRPLNGDTAEESVSGTEIVVDVPDHLTILEIR